MIPGDQEAVRELFEAVAPRYDQLNDLLSFGGHRLWGRRLSGLLQEATEGGQASR